jgi:hypothetical protein
MRLAHAAVAVLLAAAACSTAGTPVATTPSAKEPAHASAPEVPGSEVLKPYLGAEPLVQISHGGAEPDPYDPFVDFVVYVFRDGALIYDAEPCGTSGGIRKRQLGGDEVAAIQKLSIQHCDSLESDGRVFCTDTADLAVRCSGSKGPRRLTLTCQGARRHTPASDYVDGILRIAGLPPTYSHASRACPLIARDPVIGPMRHLVRLGNGGGPPSMMLKADLDEWRKAGQ